MSPRAACRLDALGFNQVYDYTLGFADWKAAGEPIEGTTVNVHGNVNLIWPRRARLIWPHLVGV